MGKIKCLNCGTELTMFSNAACPACGIRLSHAKNSFLAYLGPEDSLAGYQRSYKLVLLKSIFEECLDGNAYRGARSVGAGPCMQHSLQHSRSGTERIEYPQDSIGYVC